MSEETFKIHANETQISLLIRKRRIRSESSLRSPGSVLPTAQLINDYGGTQSTGLAGAEPNVLPLQEGIH